MKIAHTTYTYFIEFLDCLIVCFYRHLCEHIRWTPWSVILTVVTPRMYEHEHDLTGVWTTDGSQWWKYYLYYAYNTNRQMLFLTLHTYHCYFCLPTTMSTLMKCVHSIFSRKSTCTVTLNITPQLPFQDFFFIYYPCQSRVISSHKNRPMKQQAYLYGRLTPSDHCM